MRSTSPAGDPNTDKLAQILDAGDPAAPDRPAYPPASFAVEGAERAADTACAPTELTAPEVDGYDVAVGKASPPTSASSRASSPRSGPS